MKIDYGVLLHANSEGLISKWHMNCLLYIKTILY